MEDSSRLEAVEEAVIGIQNSLRSIEAFASQLQRGSQENEEMATAIKNLTTTTKSLESKFADSSQRLKEKAKSSDLPLWIKVLQ